MKTLLASLILLLTPYVSFAIDTSTTYNSGILVLLFVGICALIIVMQLVPAVLILFGMIKAVVPKSSKIKG